MLLYLLIYFYAKFVLISRSIITKIAVYLNLIIIPNQITNYPLYNCSYFNISRSTNRWNDCLFVSIISWQTLKKVILLYYSSTTQRNYFLIQKTLFHLIWKLQYCGTEIFSECAAQCYSCSVFLKTINRGQNTYFRFTPCTVIKVWFQFWKLKWIIITYQENKKSSQNIVYFVNANKSFNFRGTYSSFQKSLFSLHLDCCYQVF